MARKEIVKLVDDLDGDDIDEGGQTLTFGYRGVEYEIDLNDMNAKRLEDALAPFLSAARRQSGRKQPNTPGARTDRSQLAAMRAWAKDHGYKVSGRGRVSQEVQDAFHAAR